MSAMTMDSGGCALLAADDFHDTVLPSADTETLPSCFLYWAAASAMLVEGRWVAAISESLRLTRCGGTSQSWLPQIHALHVTTHHPSPRQASMDDECRPL
jgi:hypothetical protein